MTFTIGFNPCPKPARREKAPRKSLKRSPLKQVNRERRKRLFQEDFDSPEYLEYIHSLSCCICGVSGWTVAAHTLSRGAGGKAEDIAPMCCTRLGVEGCHVIYDERPWELGDNIKMRMRSFAKQLYAKWKARKEAA